MKFGRTLELAVYTPWKDNYIDYGKLKKLLREDETAPTSPEQWTEEDESAFVHELINVQLEKVHNFHRDTYRKLQDRTKACEAKLDDIAVAERQEQGKAEDKEGEGEEGKDTSNGNGKKALPSESEKKEISKKVLAELETITNETNELENYSRINYTGFLKAAKKHDRKRGSSYRVRPILQVRLAALPFNKEDYGPLLFRVNAMRDFCREHVDPNNDESTAPGLDGREEYVSRKYWVHPDNIAEIKAMVQRHLPILVYNPQSQKVAEGSQQDPSITSIYFDNSAFSLYSNKVDKNVGSSLRLRWYGQLDDRPEIYFEKKTVSDDETSHEARFTIKDKYIQRFLNNEYNMEKQIQKLEDRAGSDSSEVINLKSASEEVQALIQEKKLQPILRANYTRTAFQIPGDDRVRVSLDTDLAFIREDALDSDRPCRDPETWHRTDIDNNRLEYPFTSIRKGEINRFPFALLEFKVRNTGTKKNPEWINDITSSHLVKDAPRFSKFIHGVAELFEDYVNTFPFWLSQIETDIRRDPQQAFEEEQAKKQREADDELAVGSLLRSSKTGASPRTRGSRDTDAIISPVGSPAVADTLKKSPAARAARAAQIDDIAEEADEDETGVQAHNTERSFTGGFKNLIPSFSTSKYARARREGRVRLPPGVEEPKYWIKDQGPLKVEGKVWLANQRTFIKWQHVSVLLASLSLGLYNAASENNNIARALGIVYTAMAVFTAAWGYGVYMWRTDLIKRRSGKDFDAILGPMVVCVGLAVALALNFGFKYHEVMANRNPPANATMILHESYNETAFTLAHAGL